jgi:hypothetical protein
MSSQLTLSSIEGLFNVFLHPYRCQCRRLEGASLIISVQDGDLQDNSLTVAGVPLEQCRDEQQIEDLARSILEELTAIRDSATGPLPQATVTASRWSLAH